MKDIDNIFVFLSAAHTSDFWGVEVSEEQTGYNSGGWRGLRASNILRARNHNVKYEISSHKDSCFVGFGLTFDTWAFLIPLPPSFTVIGTYTLAPSLHFSSFFPSTLSFSLSWSWWHMFFPHVFVHCRNIGNIGALELKIMICSLLGPTFHPWPYTQNPFFRYPC